MKHTISVEEINRVCANTLIGHLEIEFLEYRENYISAKMPVNEKTRQPSGLLHGGASLALAETVASAGSYFMVDLEKYNVYGLQVTGNHIATVSSGILTAEAVIIHKGQTTHIWDVKISAPDGKLISTARVTNIITEKRRNNGNG